MATTTNFGWETPDDTDLVKDGAAAIRTALGGVDTSFVDLKGGTTGQVLKKATNTDLDFVWSADSAGMTNPMTTTGDVIYSSSGSTPARLGIGTAGQVLKVNSGATAPEWGTASSGLTWTLLNTGGTALTGAATITVSGISNKENIMVIVDSASSANAGAIIALRINADTGSNYKNWGTALIGGSTYSANNITTHDDNPGTYHRFALLSGSATSFAMGGAMITGGLSTGIKTIQSQGSATIGGNSGQRAYMLNGIYSGSAAITSVSLFSDSGNFDGGTLYVYGA